MYDEIRNHPQIFDWERDEIPDDEGPDDDLMPPDAALDIDDDDETFAFLWSWGSYEITHFPSHIS
jgi:hypothetical protein